MNLRTITSDDVPAVTELHHAYDTAWFGAPEHDESEVAEWLNLDEAQTCLIDDGGRVVAAATRWRTGASVVLDPRDDGTAATELVEWLGRVSAPEVEVLDRDDNLRAALSQAGWRHEYSAFELVRAVGADWSIPEPRWPPGVQVRRLAAADDEALHRLIYDDAGWAEVPGHHARDLPEWRRIFLEGRPAGEAPLLATAGGRLVGTAVLRVFSDGTGWLSQLAVARDWRGRGLGRALLLAALRTLVDQGTTRLGLSVLAANRSALQLYLDAGLRIDREWQTFKPHG